MFLSFYAFLSFKYQLHAYIVVIKILKNNHCQFEKKNWFKPL